MNATTRDSVRDALMATLREFLGDRNSVQLTEATDPFRDLGLSSEDGVDFACVVSERFRCTVPNELNPFVDDAHHRPRRVGEIVDLVCGLIEKEGAHERS